MTFETTTLTPIAHAMTAAAIGAASGAHASIWGMYKDAIHEGFSTRRFVRSIVLGTIAGSFLPWLFGLNPFVAGHAVVLFGLGYAIERGAVEGWKTFIRSEDQSKYFIPMQFSLLGRPVKSRWVRAMAGLACGVVFAAALVPLALRDVRGGTAGPPFALVAGFAIGVLVAIGGAWKDAPKEGFEVAKFFRSPLMTGAIAVVISLFTTSHLQIAVAAIGYERALIETYKTFLFPSRPRGKFAGKPVLYPEMLHRRQRFVPAFASIWFAVLAAALWGR
jgi:hypothetical protein